MYASVARLGLPKKLPVASFAGQVNQKPKVFVNRIINKMLYPAEDDDN